MIRLLAKSLFLFVLCFVCAATDKKEEEEKKSLPPALSKEESLRKALKTRSKNDYDQAVKKYNTDLEQLSSDVYAFFKDKNFEELKSWFSDQKRKPPKDFLAKLINPKRVAKNDQGKGWSNEQLIEAFEACFQHMVLSRDTQLWNLLAHRSNDTAPSPTSETRKKLFQALKKRSEDDYNQAVKEYKDLGQLYKDVYAFFKDKNFEELKSWFSDPKRKPPKDFLAKLIDPKRVTKNDQDKGWSDQQLTEAFKACFQHMVLSGDTQLWNLLAHRSNDTAPPSASATRKKLFQALKKRSEDDYNKVVKEYKDLGQLYKDVYAFFRNKNFEELKSWFSDPKRRPPKDFLIKLIDPKRVTKNDQDKGWSDQQLTEAFKACFQHMVLSGDTQLWDRLVHRLMHKEPPVSSLSRITQEVVSKLLSDKKWLQKLFDFSVEPTTKAFMKESIPETLHGLTTFLSKMDKVFHQTFRETLNMSAKEQLLDNRKALMRDVLDRGHRMFTQSFLGILVDKNFIGQQPRKLRNMYYLNIMFPTTDDWKNLSKNTLERLKTDLNEAMAYFAAKSTGKGKKMLHGKFLHKCIIDDNNGEMARVVKYIDVQNTEQLNPKGFKDWLRKGAFLDHLLTRSQTYDQEWSKIKKNGRRLIELGFLFSAKDFNDAQGGGLKKKAKNFNDAQGWGLKEKNEELSLQHQKDCWKCALLANPPSDATNLVNNLIKQINIIAKKKVFHLPKSIIGLLCGGGAQSKDEKLKKCVRDFFTTTYFLQKIKEEKWQDLSSLRTNQNVSCKLFDELLQTMLQQQQNRERLVREMSSCIENKKERSFAAWKQLVCHREAGKISFSNLLKETLISMTTPPQLAGGSKSTATSNPLPLPQNWLVENLITAHPNLFLIDVLKHLNTKDLQEVMDTSIDDSEEKRPLFHRLILDEAKVPFTAIRGIFSGSPWGEEEARRNLLDQLIIRLLDKKKASTNDEKEEERELRQSEKEKLLLAACGNGTYEFHEKNWKTWQDLKRDTSFKHFRIRHELRLNIKKKLISSDLIRDKVEDNEIEGVIQLIRAEDYAMVKKWITEKPPKNLPQGGKQHLAPLVKVLALLPANKEKKESIQSLFHQVFWTLIKSDNYPAYLLFKEKLKFFEKNQRPNKKSKFAWSVEPFKEWLEEGTIQTLRVWTELVLNQSQGERYSQEWLKIQEHLPSLLHNIFFLNKGQKADEEVILQLLLGMSNHSRAELFNRLKRSHATLDCLTRIFTLGPLEREMALRKGPHAIGSQPKILASSIFRKCMVQKMRIATLLRQQQLLPQILPQLQQKITKGKKVLDLKLLQDFWTWDHYQMFADAEASFLRKPEVMGLLQQYWKDGQNVTPHLDVEEKFWKDLLLAMLPNQPAHGKKRIYNKESYDWFYHFFATLYSSQHEQKIGIAAVAATRQIVFRAADQIVQGFYKKSNQEYRKKIIDPLIRSMIAFGLDQQGQGRDGKDPGREWLQAILKRRTALEDVKMILTIGDPDAKINHHAFQKMMQEDAPIALLLQKKLALMLQRLVVEVVNSFATQKSPAISYPIFKNKKGHARLNSLEKLLFGEIEHPFQKILGSIFANQKVLQLFWKNVKSQHPYMLIWVLDHFDEAKLCQVMTFHIQGKKSAAQWLREDLKKSWGTSDFQQEEVQSILSKYEKAKRGEKKEEEKTQLQLPDRCQKLIHHLKTLIQGPPTLLKNTQLQLDQLEKTIRSTNEETTDHLEQVEQQLETLFEKEKERHDLAPTAGLQQYVEKSYDEYEEKAPIHRTQHVPLLVVNSQLRKLNKIAQKQAVDSSDDTSENKDNTSQKGNDTDEDEDDDETNEGGDDNNPLVTGTGGNNDIVVYNPQRRPKKKQPKQQEEKKDWTVPQIIGVFAVCSTLAFVIYEVSREYLLPKIGGKQKQQLSRQGNRKKRGRSK